MIFHEIGYNAYDSFIFCLVFKLISKFSLLTIYVTERKFLFAPFQIQFYEHQGIYHFYLNQEHG